MTDSKPETAKESHQPKPAKAPYRSPRLEILGSLRSATRGTGADGALGMTMMSDRRAKEDIVKSAGIRWGSALSVPLQSAISSCMALVAISA